VDLGRAGERYFVFASGVGLDASVVERVDRHPLRKAKYGSWYYAYAAVDIFLRHYLVRPPHVRVRAADRTLQGVTVIVQNSDPFTYFRKRPIRIASEAGLTTGSLGAAVLKSATPLELPTMVPRLLSGRAKTVLRHRQVESLGELPSLRVEAMDERPFPVQVDGDYIGEFGEIEFSAAPGALFAVS
jgi:diacylglycerol kinase family enzyme